MTGSGSRRSPALSWRSGPEAAQDVDHIAEQPGLEKADFHREGVLRHAQYLLGQWHDLVLCSRLRDDRLL
jgi:hypothetical protein